MFNVWKFLLLSLCCKLPNAKTLDQNFLLVSHKGNAKKSVCLFCALCYVYFFIKKSWCWFCAPSMQELICIRPEENCGSRDHCKKLGKIRTNTGKLRKIEFFFNNSEKLGNLGLLGTLKHIFHWIFHSLLKHKILKV